MKRHKHSLSYYKLVTFDMAELVPVACFEVLPGDSVQQATSALLRVSPLLAPVMHPVSVRIHHWFVPHRLVWSDWEKFITGGSDGLGEGAVYPTITAGGGGFTQGQLLDYLGCPPAVANLVVSALPVRSYNLIYNEYYRDEDLITKLVVPVAGGADSTSPLVVQKVAWEKDYFTAARPWTQKGPAVTLPLGTSATVKTSSSDLLTGAQPGLRAKLAGAGGSLSAGIAWGNVDANNVGQLTSNVGASTGQVYPSNLFADLSTATAVDVNTVRRAFALQRYEEARALYGSRYTEYLRYLGVRSSDARLQRPEYLGGGKQTIAFSEVLQTGVTTSGTPDIGVASIKGHGISAMRSRRYRRFFEEHGFVISLMSVRPRTMYANTMSRKFLRRTKEDYWQRELEDIGQQAVARREIFAEAGAGGDTVFGYTDRYSEYRHHFSELGGEFRSTLNFWHLARILAGAPTLNQSFVECDPSKRINQVGGSNDTLWVMVSNSIQARRMVKRTGIGRVL